MRRTIVLALCLLLLDGCAAWRAFTLRGDENSFKRNKEQVEIFVVEKSAKAMDLPAIRREGFDLPVSVLEDCIPDEQLFVPLAAGAIVFVAGVVIDAGLTAVAGWLEREQKKYRATHGTRVNRPLLQFDSIPATRCIYYRRRFKEKDDETDNPPDITGLQLVLKFEKIGGSALGLRPIYLNMPNAAAKTGKGDGIDLNVALAISTIVEDSPRRKLELLTSQTFEFRKVPIGGEAFDLSKWTEVSSLIPEPLNPGPATIALAVTETGSGYKDFGKVKDFVEANKKAVRDALTGALEGALE